MFQLQVRRMIFRIIMGCLLVLAAARAGADPIVIGITGGFLDMVDNGLRGSLMLSGEHGFTFSAGVNATEGFFGPYEHCTALSPPTCRAGSSLDLAGNWVGSGVRGDVTLDGVTYTHVGDPFGPDSMGVAFAGVATLPPIADSATVVAPFTFSGFFLHTGPGAFRDPLEGFGTATLSLAPYPGIPDHWLLTGARYDFAPTPEPASLLLVTAGLAGTVLRFRKRQPRGRT